MMLNAQHPAVNTSQRMDPDLYSRLAFKMITPPTWVVPFVTETGHITQVWFDRFELSGIADLPDQLSPVINTTTRRLKPDWLQALQTFLET